jgi:hypothetical protein
MNTPEQILAVLNFVRTKPAWPSAVEVPGLNKFDAHHQGVKQRLFEDLHSRGLIEMVPPPNGRRTGPGYRVTLKGESERKLLLTMPGAKKL